MRKFAELRIATRNERVYQYTERIECLRSVVTVAGQTMQRVAPHLMCALMGRLHDAYLEPSIPPRMRMVLLELIELRASGWQLKTSTQMYYNPGKAFQHHE
ncbi:hypothetical protein HPB49_012132 [Dermacentor silvarum]|uniref:Uncharacterized protein n=1 Tax=Dermacentor silvarum TaxID=543639 RepID=A0ACB8DD70_DERSI|nr:hypothetical protein HPB49_012132 [Dermacentor silvarum]